jgi:hypothetical protein
MFVRALVSLVLLGLVGSAGCARVRPWERERLASPAMQFQMAPFAEGQRDSVLEITEGSTFSGAGPGGAGAGCGCH